MKRYSILYGMDGTNGYRKLTDDQQVLEFAVRCGADNAPRIPQVTAQLLGGFYPLEGYGDQPMRDRPVTVRYAPMNLGKREDMPSGLKPFCALTVSGLDTESGSKMYCYDHLVMMDKEELLQNGDFCYLDHLFGTYLVNSNDANRMRRKGKLDCGKLPQKVTPRMHREDAEAVYAAVEAIFGGKIVILRVEKGMVFNSRSMDLLMQIYSLLPARLAVETGFASYQDPIKIRRIVKDTGIRVYVVPAEADLEYTVEDAVVLDLNDPESIQSSGGLLVKCLKKWSQLTWDERRDSMDKLLFNAGAGVRDVQYIAKVTSNFFGDPFFRHTPEAGSCATLEELKQALDGFQVLRYEIDWVNRRMREMAEKMLVEGAKLPQLKAEAAAKARTASSPEERKKYTALYRFAQRLDPSDASLHAIVQMETSVAERVAEEKEMVSRELAAENLALLEKREAEQKKTSAEALAAQKKEMEETLAKQKKTSDEALARQKRESDAALAAQKKASEEALAKQKRDYEKRLAASATAAGTNGTQVANLQKRIQEMTADHASELKKLKDAHAAEIQQLKFAHAEEVRKARAGSQNGAAANSLQVENLQKRVREMTAAHEAELKKLNDQYTRELAAARARSGNAAVPQPGANPAAEARAKQIIASQLLRNLAEIEALKKSHRAELESLKKA